MIGRIKTILVHMFYNCIKPHLGGICITVFPINVICKNIKYNVFVCNIISIIIQKILVIKLKHVYTLSYLFYIFLWDFLIYNLINTHSLNKLYLSFQNNNVCYFKD